MSDRDTLTPPSRDSNAGKDREVGRAFRYAGIVAIIVAACVTTVVQLSNVIDTRMERAIAAKADRADLQVRNVEVASEIKQLRTERDADGRELARILERVADRLTALEQRTASATKRRP